MDEQLLTILVVLIVAMIAFGLFQIGAGLLKGNRRRLKQRLVTGGDSSVLAELPRSISVRINGGGTTGLLIQYAFFRNLYKRLHQAFPEVTLTQFLMVAGALSSVAFTTGLLVSGSPLVGLCAGAGFGYAPFWVVESQRQRRIRKITEQLPEALDFMSRVLRAGHSLGTALRMMGEELPNPLADEFRRCYAQHSLGQPLEDCLKDMTARVESTDFAFFVTAVVIQRQTGGDLSNVLGNISGMVRQRVRLVSQTKAKTAEGRFTGYILVAFPVIMFFLAYFMNPHYAGTLLHTESGRYLLGTAIGLEVIGLVAIRKITTIRV
jgi:tight adherence protein B